MPAGDLPSIGVDQLRVGLYVHIDLKWFEHPFAFNSFKIKDAAQIAAIRGLGVGRIRFDPARSDSTPLPHEAAERRPAAEATPPKEHPALAAKRALVEKIRQQREAAARIEHAFVDTARTLRDIDRNLLNDPAKTVAQADMLVAQIAESILSAPELAIHVMGEKIGGEELYFHSLNVTMLSLMVAREIRLPQEAVRPLGMGALFHDIGVREIPAKILMKKEPLTPAEKNLYELHCEYGVAIGRRLGFSSAVLSIIGEHHELYDGSGYPKRLAGDAINLLARIVAIANYYDELCNPANALDALTPHEALATMFARLRTRFDSRLLQAFVRSLGVYPPGTVVQLSNGVIGMVATINTAKPMKPMLVVYDEEIPKEEALLVDLETEPDINIARALRPGQLPREIYTYLDPRKQVSYYFDAGAASKETVRP